MAARAVAFLGAASAFCAATMLFAQTAPKAARPPRVVSPRSTLGPPAVTFNNQVARILQANCQKCHHKGGIAPFPLLTYDDALARKSDIVSQTGQRKMPPWHIDSSCAAYQGDPALSAADIQTLASWATSGAPEGDAKDLPAPLTFDNGWSLGPPDQVLTMADPFKPNFVGGDVYRCFVLPTGLTEDRFVRAVEIAPGSRQIVHHVLLFLDTSGAADRLDQQDPDPGYSCFGGPGFDVSATAPSLGGWAPGNQPRFLPDGIGMFLPRGARIVMQVHYSAHNGIGQLDQSSLALYFTRAPVNKKLYIAPVINKSFVIPPGAADYAVQASIPFLPFDAHLLGITPHMHLLGRTMSVAARLPDGKEMCLGHVPDWDFNWQYTYTYNNSAAAPFGTAFDVEAHYDNSSGNYRNPNRPPKAVSWGENTTDEMCIAFLSLTVDAENLLSAAASSRPAAVEALEPFLQNLWSQMSFDRPSPASAEPRR